MKKILASACLFLAFGMPAMAAMLETPPDILVVSADEEVVPIPSINLVHDDNEPTIGPSFAETHLPGQRRYHVTSVDPLRGCQSPPLICTAVAARDSPSDLAHA